MQISPLHLGDRDALTEVTDLARASVEQGAPWLHRPTVDQLASALRHGHDGEPALTLLEERAYAVGRVKLGADAGEGSPGTHFAEQHGYLARSRAILRRQHLGDDLVDRVRRVHAEATVAAQDYEVLRWSGRTPDELLDEVARVAESVIDAPSDDLNLEPDTFDPLRVRDFEEATERRGRSLHRVLDRHRATGEYAGLSTVVVEGETPTVAHQLDTTPGTPSPTRTWSR